MCVTQAVCTTSDTGQGHEGVNMATLRASKCTFIQLLTQCWADGVADLEPALMRPRQGAAIRRGHRHRGHLCNEAMTGERVVLILWGCWALGGPGRAVGLLSGSHP